MIALLASLPGCILIDHGNDDKLFDASVAGEDWIADESDARLDGQFVGIRGKRGDIEGGNYETIFVGISEFDGTGRYPLAAEHGSYYRFVGGDGVTVVDNSGGGSDDYVTVTGYDSTKGVLRGEFSFDAVALAPFAGGDKGTEFTVSGRFRVDMSE